MTWPFILGLIVGLCPFFAVAMRRRGHTARGRFETSTHVCRPPRPTRALPEGTRWRCRRCGMSWTLDTHGASWRCRYCRTEWKHDTRPARDPGPWGTTSARIAEMERELGLGGPNP